MLPLSQTYRLKRVLKNDFSEISVVAFFRKIMKDCFWSTLVVVLDQIDDVSSFTL